MREIILEIIGKSKTYEIELVELDPPFAFYALNQWAKKRKTNFTDKFQMNMYQIQA